MRMHWRLILPILGLILFGAESLHSLQLNRHQRIQKYFYWSFLPLDSDPLNKNIKEPSPASEWELRSVWIDPGYLTKLLMLSAFPAFILGMGIVKLLGHLGVSEVLSFAITMPLLILAWFYALGRLIDYWASKGSYHSGFVKKKLTSLFLLLALVAMGALSSVVYRFSREWLIVDRCLSARHGSFDYTTMSCDLESNHPYIPYQVRHPLDERTALVAFVSFAGFLSGYFYSRTSHKTT